MNTRPRPRCSRPVFARPVFARSVSSDLVARHFLRLAGLLALACVVAISGAPARAAEHTLALDPDETSITFLLEATAHDVEGFFVLEDGRIVFDPETGEASGALRIDARRADTGNTRRDKEMHAEVLESEAHPWIVYTVQGIEGELPDTGAGELTLVGRVDLLGTAHPLNLPTTVQVDGDQVQASTTFSVPFVAWGLHDPSMWLLKVAKEVQVTVETSGTLTTSEPADADTPVDAGDDDEPADAVEPDGDTPNPDPESR